MSTYRRNELNETVSLPSPSSTPSPLPLPRPQLPLVAIGPLGGGASWSGLCVVGVAVEVAVEVAVDEEGEG